MITSFFDTSGIFRTSDKELACGLILYSPASDIDTENLEIDAVVKNDSCSETIYELKITIAVKY